MGKKWDRLDGSRDWQSGGGFSKPGIGKRETEWPSFSAGDPVHGAANPTCALCGGRLRGVKKCSCEQPHDHWKAIGKRRNVEPGMESPSEGSVGQCEEISSLSLKVIQVHGMQSWHEAWLKECFRVLKPGGVIKAFGGTRTFHRLAAAMESVGFVLDPKDSIEAWVYASGFPKSLNISKSLDKMQGAEREVIGEVRRWGANASGGRGGQNANGFQESIKGAERMDPVTAPATDAAKKWTGYGTALKPAFEPFVVGHKPTIE